MFCKLYAALLYGESAHHCINDQSDPQALRGENRLPQETPRPHGKHFYAVRPRAALRP